MNSDAYEALVRELVTQFSGCASLRGAEIRGGRRNRISGRSAYLHQIDVSVHTPRVLLLVECKYWSRPVSTGAVLTLASRLADIRANEPGMTVHASLVSTRAVSVNAQTLAEHFGVQLDTVKNVAEYVFRIADHVFASLSDSIGVSDGFIAVVTRGNTA